MAPETTELERYDKIIAALRAEACLLQEKYDNGGLPYSPNRRYYSGGRMHYGCSVPASSASKKAAEEAWRHIARYEEYRPLVARGLMTAADAAKQVAEDRRVERRKGTE